MDHPEVIARIEILKLPSGLPGVRLSALDDFMEIPPVERAILMAAVIQLCGAAIEAIYEDHPEEQNEIRRGLDAVMIEPKQNTIN